MLFSLFVFFVLEAWETPVQIRALIIIIHHLAVDSTVSGYNHNGNDTAKGYANLTTEEKTMIVRFKKLWDNNKGI